MSEEEEDVIDVEGLVIYSRNRARGTGISEANRSVSMFLRILKRLIMRGKKAIALLWTLFLIKLSLSRMKG